VAAASALHERLAGAEVLLQLSQFFLRGEECCWVAPQERQEHFHRIVGGRERSSPSLEVAPVQVLECRLKKVSYWCITCANLKNAELLFCVRRVSSFN